MARRGGWVCSPENWTARGLHTRSLLGVLQPKPRSYDMHSKNSGNVPAVLTYEGEIITAKSNMLSLTDMWRAAKGDPSKSPAQWQRLPSSIEFVDHLELIVGKSHDNLIDARKRGGTFAHWQIALAYAKYLSPEFHMWCNTVVRERMEGKSISIAGLSPEMIEMIRRTDGIARQLSHKVTVIEQMLPGIAKQAAEAAIASDPRRAVMNYVSVRTLLDEAKAIRKGRNSLNRKIGHALRDLALIEPDGGKAARCPHSGVWLFQCDFAARYMRDAGKTLVKQHNDRVNGQGALRLVGGKANDYQPSTGV